MGFFSSFNLCVMWEKKIMKTYTLLTWDKREILFSGVYATFQACIEDAILKSTNLSYADLSGCDLSHINMDGYVFRHVKFSECNLSGANMSEASFMNCNFDNTSFYGACFAFSSLQSCSFNGCLFGGTDIAGATIVKCIFSTHSAMMLNFLDARVLHDCSYLYQDDDTSILFSKPPVTIQGLEYPVLIFGHSILIGQQRFSVDDLHEYANDNLLLQRPYSSQFYIFVQKYKITLLGLLQSGRQTSIMTCNS